MSPLPTVKALLSMGAPARLVQLFNPCMMDSLLVYVETKVIPPGLDLDRSASGMYTLPNPF